MPTPGETDRPTLIIDGSSFSDLDGFCRAFSSFLTDYTWTGNLDAFNDLLRGGFGTPEGGFVLRWLDSDHSRSALGWAATTQYLEQKLQRCHPANREAVRRDLARASRGEGATLFDTIVEIIRDHGEGGSEAADGIHLELL
jgi:hypothetical protein